jgi:endonuclease/exonuclease/phosphatase (EEP) superfamily protein YafD
VSQFENRSVTDAKPAAVPAEKPKRKRHRQWGGAVAFLLIGIGGLVAGRLGQLYPHFDVFSQFGLQFCAMVFAFAVALFMSRYKTLFGLSLFVLLLAAYGAWPHMISSQLQKPPYILAAGEKLLRVAHFNTYKNNADYAVIIAEILRLDADVATLVEMSPAKKKAVLPALKAQYPYTFDCAGGQFCDMAIISKYPITAGDGLGEWVGAPYVRASLGGDMAGITIVGVHTTRFPHSRAQLKQVTELVKLFEGILDELVVMGDFNATPFSRVTTSLEQGANLTRLTELPTWPTYAQLPQLAIDHVFASKSFRVVADEQIGNAAGSDHYPILLTLAFKPKP